MRARAASMTFLLSAFLSSLYSPASALDQIFSQTGADLSNETKVGLNGAFEEGEGKPREDGKGLELDGWKFWQEGYEIAPGAGRNGSRAIRCTLTDTKLQYGAGQELLLNQEKPLPLIASGWSKAQDVSGYPDSNYSIYLDFIFQDGSTWFGQTANFTTGTHDWQERRFVVVPQKPVKTVFFYAIFRGHQGTVFFDDFELIELRGETYMFEGVPVQPQPLRAPVEKVWIPYMETRNGLQMALERDRARVCGVWVNQEKVGLNGPGFFARDVAAGSDFLSPWKWDFKQEGTSLTINGEIDPLDLGLTAQFSTQRDHIQVRGVVRDTRGEDRAVTVYFALPVDDGGWLWCDDPRNNIPATATVYMNAAMTGAGATGSRSSLPFAAICREDQKRGIALAVPLDEPRHYRLGFDARTGMFYAAFDFGLSPSATKTPSQATFSFVIYPFAATWGLRGAAATYYELFPQYFTRRTPTAGLWLADTDPSTIESPEDFGFAFHHKRDNAGLQARPGLLSFFCTDPTNIYMSMPDAQARNYEGAMGELDGRLSGSELDTDHAAATAQVSGVRHPTGEYAVGMANTPWCNGAVFTANPDPDIAGTTAKGQTELAQIADSMAGKSKPVLMDWLPVGLGYSVDDNTSRSGRQSLRLDATKSGGPGGASQRVKLDQSEAKPLTLRAYARAKGIKSRSASPCSITLEFNYPDGGSAKSEAFAIEESPRDFSEIEHTITPEKPVATAIVWLNLQDERTATVNVDDVFLGEKGGDNLLKDGGMEGQTADMGNVAGVYIAGVGGNVINYNKTHFAMADHPLVFDTHTHELGILNSASSFEFDLEVAKHAREQGKLIMSGGGPLSDVICAKVDWGRGGTWSPDYDSSMITRRMLNYQKPMCLLMNTDFDKFTRDPGSQAAEGADQPRSLYMTERYMQRALFYALYPSFFSKDDFSEPYFQNPDLYNQARPLFKKYVPLVKTLDEAGWEPLTGAISSNPEVFVERYGNQEKGEVFIAATYGDRKWTGDLDAKKSEQEKSPPAAASIDLNMAYVGFLGQDVEVHDMLNDKPVEITSEQSHVIYKVELEPYTTSLVRVRPRK